MPQLNTVKHTQPNINVPTSLELKDFEVIST